MSIPPARPPLPSGAAAQTPKTETPAKEKGNAQRHSAGTIDYDNVEACGSAEGSEDNQQPVFRGRSQTFGEKKSIRRIDSSEARDGDPGVKSENEDDPPPRSNKPSLGRTPYHLSLSTTSTLSTGSSCSQAKLVHVSQLSFPRSSRSRELRVKLCSFSCVQASRTPQSYKQEIAKPLGSPIWKPREGVGESFTLPRPAKSTDMPNVGAAATKNPYNTLGYPSKK